MIGSFFVGLVLSQVIAIVGLLLVDQAVGSKFLPIYTGIVCAIIALLIAARGQQRVQQAGSIHNVTLAD